jgi:protein gp37
VPPVGDKTRIEWTDATWSVVTGCSKHSPGCAHCYAERQALGRLKGKPGYPGLPWTPANAETNVVLHPRRLELPLRWRRPRMVFVCSMADLFHERVPDEFIDRVFSVIADASQHVFQVLTKRPERMRDYMLLAKARAESGGDVMPGACWSDPMGAPLYQFPLPNVWLGTSIENRRFIGRADVLRDTPAAVRFISAEPLLGPLIKRGDGWMDGYPGEGLELSELDWLIAGGESGPGHRPMRWEWVRDLRDACRGTGTALFVKQGGGLRPGSTLEELPEDLRIREWPQLAGRGQ